MPTELAVPLSERCEFGSQRWCETMQQFIASSYEQIASGLKFSYAMELSNPPNHLDCGEACGYTVRLTGENAVVENSPHRDVDFYQCANYNSMLPFMCTTLGRHGANSNRSFREHVFREHSRIHQPIGTWPNHDALLELTTVVHDFMAIRTINNPDVEHRIQHLGLASNFEELEESGYTVLENAFTSDFANELRAEAAVNHAAAPPDSGFRACMLLQRGRIWEEAVLHPWVLALMEYLLGRGCLIYQSDTIIKGPGLDTHPGLHSDYGASAVPEPFPEYCLEATAVWAIDDFTIENGPTVIVPGSYRNRSQVPQGTTRDEAKPIVMESGSIALWHGATWHGAMARTAPGTRTSLHNAYCRQFMRPLENYLEIPKDVIDRNSLGIFHAVRSR